MLPCVYTMCTSVWDDKEAKYVYSTWAPWSVLSIHAKCYLRICTSVRRMDKHWLLTVTYWGSNQNDIRLSTRWLIMWEQLHSFIFSFDFNFPISPNLHFTPKLQLCCCVINPLHLQPCNHPLISRVILTEISDSQNGPLHNIWWCRSRVNSMYTFLHQKIMKLGGYNIIIINE